MAFHRFWVSFSESPSGRIRGPADLIWAWLASMRALGHPGPGWGAAGACFLMKNGFWELDLSEKCGFSYFGHRGCTAAETAALSVSGRSSELFPAPGGTGACLGVQFVAHAAHTAHAAHRCPASTLSVNRNSPISAEAGAVRLASLI